MKKEGFKPMAIQDEIDPNCNGSPMECAAQRFRGSQELQNEVAKGDADPPAEETKKEKNPLEERQVVPSTYAAGGNQEMSDELLAGGNQNLANVNKLIW